jgi:hypothetical protein
MPSDDAAGISERPDRIDLDAQHASPSLRSKGAPGEALGASGSYASAAVLQEPPSGVRFGVKRLSPDRLKADAVTAVYRAVAGAGVAAALFIGIWRSPLGMSVSVAMWLDMALSVVAVISLSIGRAHAVWLRVEAAKEDANELRAASSDGGPGTSVQLISLQIQRYQQQGLEHAQTSFRHGQVAMVMALLILLGGGATVTFWAGRDSRYIIGGLTGLGTLLSSFLGATFLASRDKAVEQLNRSHAIPQVSLLLSAAASFAERVSAGRPRDETWKMIVGHTVAAADNTLAGLLTTPAASARSRVAKRGSVEGVGSTSRTEAARES